MHFNGPIVRPQTDADSLFIEVTVGCTHNSCSFCNFYKGYPFGVASLEQIESDLREASRRYPKVRKIWANGGNPYALPTDRLEKVGNLIKSYFPEARISTYARVDDLTRKTAEEMKRLKKAGFEDIVIGFETGDDEALSYVNKGYTSADIITGCRRLEEADVSYRMIFLGGLSGKGKCEAAGRKTAELLNQLHPYMLYLNSVSVLPGTKLYEERESGLFNEADERELVMEFVALLENMTNEIEVFAAPNTTPFSFHINLQPNKEKLINEMLSYAKRLADPSYKDWIELRRHQRSV